MFFNILIILYLFILKEHTCSCKEPPCTPETYPVTPDWTFESNSLPPVNLTQTLDVTDDGTASIIVSINDQSDDFNLTLLANPFVKNDSELYPGPELNTSDYNLRRFYTTCEILKEDNFLTLNYCKIFTGWYYLVITNNNGTRWKFEPKYYETNYPFIDMRVQLKDKGIFKPETTETTMSYYVNLRVPLDCIIIKVKIYECKEKVDGAIKHIEHGRLQATQSCWITNIGEENIHAFCYSISHIKLDVRCEREVTNDMYNNTWTVFMVWKNLTHGGGNYYLDYSNHDSTKCDKRFGQEAVETWKLIKDHIYVDLGEHLEKDELRQPVTEENVIQLKHWLWITSFLVVFVSVIIMYYWVMRCRRLKDLSKEGEKPTGIPKEPSNSINDKKSNQILLIYVRGCFHFEKEIEDIKERLRSCCSGYKIRDVYAPSEFKYLGDVKKWVDEILKAGSKVIWFDTPQLRSRLNCQDKDRTFIDFRDEAVPYAFELARDLYRDAHSQYCYHFVVQMEEFKVEKEQDDPLQSFTPHIRWLLPGRFIDLCEKLNGLIEPSRRHQNSYTEIKFDSSSYNRTACMI